MEAPGHVPSVPSPKSGTGYSEPKCNSVNSEQELKYTFVIND